jgi:hypothetical protein
LSLSGEQNARDREHLRGLPVSKTIERAGLRFRPVFRFPRTPSQSGSPRRAGGRRKAVGGVAARCTLVLAIGQGVRCNLGSCQRCLCCGKGGRILKCRWTSPWAILPACSRSNPKKRL